MTPRTGTCTGCDAKYKIPETFKGTKAKCKKCGGVVEIPPLEEAAQPAPEPEPSAAAEEAAPADGVKAGGVATRRKTAGAVRRGGRRGAARGKKAAPAGKRRSSRGRGGDDEDEGGNKTVIWVVAGVSAVAIIVILVILFTGGDDKPNTDDLALNETPEVVEDTPATTEETSTDGDESAEEAPETTEPDPLDVAPEETTPEVVEPEDIDPVIELDVVLPPIIGCEQETFDRLTECFTDGFVKQELPPWKRKTLMKEFQESGFEKIPVLLNAFNGLDLLKSDDVVVAYRTAEMWNKLTGEGFVDVPIKGDTTQEEMEANLDLNVKNVYAIYNIWKKKIDDVEAQRTFFSKCEKYQRKAAAKEADG